jgi:hypothetical protein
MKMVIDPENGSMATYKRAARRDLRRTLPPGLDLLEEEVPLQVMVPARVRRQVGLLSAERGEPLRTTILRGLLAIGIDVPESELVDRRGRKRQE